MKPVKGSLILNEQTREAIAVWNEDAPSVVSGYMIAMRQIEGHHFTFKVQLEYGKKHSGLAVWLTDATEPADLAGLAGITPLDDYAEEELALRGMRFLAHNGSNYLWRAIRDGEVISYTDQRLATIAYNRKNAELNRRYASEEAARNFAPDREEASMQAIREFHARTTMAAKEDSARQKARAFAAKTAEPIAYIHIGRATVAK